MATRSPDSTLTEKANAAFRQATLSVIERARHTGTPVIVWENGHVVEYSCDERKPFPDQASDRGEPSIGATPRPESQPHDQGLEP